MTNWMQRSIAAAIVLAVLVLVFSGPGPVGAQNGGTVLTGAELTRVCRRGFIFRRRVRRRRCATPRPRVSGPIAM